jgi:small subunit ribosomal protein S9
MTAVVKETIIKADSSLDTKLRVPQIDKLGRSYATGKRKNSIAKVWIKKGKGNIIVNDKPAKEYLKRDILNVIINQPFEKTETKGMFDVTVSTNGGGLSGQAGAIRHGISVALQKFDPSLRAVLKTAGFLTRDSRIVERKKPGLRKARKGQTYRKR